MTIAGKIAPHLPYLRRYARALTGSQASGDAWVEGVLKSMIQTPDAFPADLSAKIALFRVFADLWNAPPGRRRDLAAEAGNPVDRNLSAMTPLPRQAFLLRSVEGFNGEEVGSILGAAAAQVDDWLQSANQEIALQMSTDILIIEDEPLIAYDLEQIVEELGHRLIGVARTLKEATALATGKQPGLVLADIQLADGSSGIDAVDEILKQGEAPVIFITAFPILLLTGKGPEPTFLIAKPFEADAVKAAVSQALFFDRKAARRVA